MKLATAEVIIIIGLFLVGLSVGWHLMDWVEHHVS